MTEVLGVNPFDPLWSSEGGDRSHEALGQVVEVLLTSRKQARAARDFQTADAIRDQLAMQVRRQKVDAEIQKQVAAAKIEKTDGLDAALLNKTDLLDK